MIKSKIKYENSKKEAYTDAKKPQQTSQENLNPEALHQVPLLH